MSRNPTPSQLNEPLPNHRRFVYPQSTDYITVDTPWDPSVRVCLSQTLELIEVREVDVNRRRITTDDTFLGVDVQFESYSIDEAIAASRLQRPFRLAFIARSQLTAYSAVYASSHQNRDPLEDRHATLAYQLAGMGVLDSESLGGVCGTIELVRIRTGVDFYRQFGFTPEESAVLLRSHPVSNASPLFSLESVQRGQSLALDYLHGLGRQSTTPTPAVLPTKPERRANLTHRPRGRLSVIR